MTTQPQQSRIVVRQGDVGILTTTPRDLDRVIEPVNDPRGAVLGEGDSSAHYHVATGPNVRLSRFVVNRGQPAPLVRLLQVGDGGATLETVGGGSGDRPRHDPIPLEPGQYLVRNQDQWSAQDERAVNVAD